jgi:hypothetical protein
MLQQCEAGFAEPSREPSVIHRAAAAAPFSATSRLKPPPIIFKVSISSQTLMQHKILIRKNIIFAYVSVNFSSDFAKQLLKLLIFQ